MENRIICCLQARMGSTRLPGKSMMNVGGLPLAVLAAKRASGNRFSLIVATSDSVDDDILCKALNNEDIPVFRGHPTNVLKRFYDATINENETSILVRLTGDNCFPDTNFIQELIDRFMDEPVDILNLSTKNSPYGLSAEIMRVSGIRQAYKATADPFDLEHVTPWIKKNCRTKSITLQYLKPYAHLRCTVDVQDDLERVRECFQDCQNALDISYLDLIKKLAGLSEAPKFNLCTSDYPSPGFVLGTAQLGLSYGIANKTGQPDKETSVQIIRKAIRQGALAIDSATAYGDSEHRVGEAASNGLHYLSTIITKLSPLPVEDVMVSDSELALEIDRNIKNSLLQLQLPRLPALMLHRANNIWARDGFVLSQLVKAKKQGFIEKLGASIQTPEELKRVLVNPAITVIQMPYNILDERWDHLIPELNRRSDITVHARSSFLQGALLLSNPSEWPKLDQTYSPSVLIEFLKTTANNFADGDLKKLLVRYVRSQNWIHGVVIGVELEDQLTENMKYFFEPPLKENEIDIINNLRPPVPPELLNPALWIRSN